MTETGKALEPEYDIVRDIHLNCTRYNIVLNTLYVKSHQNRKGVLPLQIFLNERCDDIAKQYVRTASREGSTKPSAVASPSEIATLFINNMMVKNNTNKWLLRASASPTLQCYLCDKYDWSSSTFYAIDWEHVEHSLQKRFSRSKNIFSRTVKFMFDIQNTGRQKKKFSLISILVPTTSDLCPCCKTQEETIMHLCQCTDAAMQNLLTNELNDLEDAL